jgi:hypothetical protein
LFIAMTGALAGLLIDFSFTLRQRAPTWAEGQHEFLCQFLHPAKFHTLLPNFATPKIQDKVGLRGGLMVLPLALIGAASFVTAAATASAARSCE